MFAAPLLVAAFLSAPPDVPPAPASSSPEQRLAFARQAAEQYRFVAKSLGTEPARLHPQPLLRWDNQVVREDDGLLFLWTEQTGRPLVAAQFFLQGTHGTTSSSRFPGTALKHTTNWLKTGLGTPLGPG